MEEENFVSGGVGREEGGETKKEKKETREKKRIE